MAITESALLLGEKLRKAEAEITALSQRNGLLTLAIVAAGGRIDIPEGLSDQLPDMAFRCERDCATGAVTLTAWINCR